MDWIHCNSCSRQPGDEKERRFALTSCGHIFCDICVVNATKDGCTICSSKCKIVELAAKMSAEVQPFFNDPERFLKKALQIMEFQRGHRLRLTEYRRNMVTRDVSPIEENKKLKNQILQMNAELKKLKQKVEYYEKSMSPANGRGHVLAGSNKTFISPLTEKLSSASLRSPAEFKSPATPNKLFISPSTHNQTQVIQSGHFAAKMNIANKSPSTVSKPVAPRISPGSSQILRTPITKLSQQPIIHKSQQHQQLNSGASKLSSTWSQNSSTSPNEVTATRLTLTSQKQKDSILNRFSPKVASARRPPSKISPYRM